MTFPSPPISWHPLAGGGNNQVFRVELENGQTVVVKKYFRHPMDTRERLKAEFSFLSYAWQKGIRCIPEPIASAPDVGVYSFLSGHPPIVTPDTLEQFLAFFLAINENPDPALPPASEALHAPIDLFHSIEHRLSALLESSARTFVISHLLPLWQRIQQPACQTALLPDRCLSPSDFGYHNALDCNSTIHFIDFEYAGWDSPIKTACDFFCQPKIPVPLAHFESFCRPFSSLWPQIQLFYPIFRLKWCCKMLSSLIGAGKARRAFASAAEEDPLAKTEAYYKETLCHI